MGKKSSILLEAEFVKKGTSAMGMIITAPLTIGRVLDVWRDGRLGQSVKLDQLGQTPAKMHTS